MTKTIIKSFAIVFSVVILFGISMAEQPVAGGPDSKKDEAASPQGLKIPELDISHGPYLMGNSVQKKLQCTDEVASPLEEECSFCHNNEVTEFTEKGEKAKVMMKAAVSIGVKCEYCHMGKKQFTDRKEIALKMFELSEMMATECSFCHAGRDILTSAGKTAKTAMILQEWAKNGNVKCLECHVEKKQYELNFHGWEVLNTQKGQLGL